MCYFVTQCTWCTLIIVVRCVCCQPGAPVLARAWQIIMIYNIVNLMLELKNMRCQLFHLKVHLHHCTVLVLSKDRKSIEEQLKKVLLAGNIFGFYFPCLSKDLCSSFSKKYQIFPPYYTTSQKHESTLLHTYVLNEFLTADRSCTTKYF